MSRREIITPANEKTTPYLHLVHVVLADGSDGPVKSRPRSPRRANRAGRRSATALRAVWRLPTCRRSTITRGHQATEIVFVLQSRQDRERL